VPRINVLLSASTLRRPPQFTDTISWSLDLVAGAVSMVSIPRDMVDVPLPDGSRFSDKINSRLYGGTTSQTPPRAARGRMSDGRPAPC
jgi:hypothetical protein